MWAQGPKRGAMPRNGSLRPEKLGIKVKDRYSTMGPYDAVLIVDAPNDEAVTTWVLSIGSRGNNRTFVILVS